jgi:hypothetical protein
MGLFKKIKKAAKAVTHPVSTVKTVAKTALSNPIRVTTAVASLGLSEVARELPVVGSVVKEAQSTASALYQAAANVYTVGTYGAATSLGSEILEPTPEADMGLNLGNLVGGLGQIVGNLGTNTGNPYLQGAGTIATAFGGAYSTNAIATPVSQNMNMQPMTVSQNLPSVRGGALTKDIFTAGSMLLGKLGLGFPATTSGFSAVLKRALSSIASLARRTPTGTMVSLLVGLGLGAYEASLLTIWHTQRRKGRRMNPANSKALRRAARRIRGFHKLCQHTDLLKTRRTSFSRSSRCTSCKKSPCRC